MALTDLDSALQAARESIQSLTQKREEREIKQEELANATAALEQATQTEDAAKIQAVAAAQEVLRQYEANGLIILPPAPEPIPDTEPVVTV